MTRVITTSPTVHRITKTLSERIVNQEYAEGQWIPTERELAEEFAVSRATIRLALADLTEQKLLERLPGCRPTIRNQTPARADAARTARHTLGLWLSGDPQDVGGALTVRGLLRVLDQDTYRLVVEQHRGNTLDSLIESEAQALQRFARDNDISGLIVWYFGGSRNLPLLEMLNTAGIPMVFVDRRPPEGFAADHVGINNTLAARRIVEHLIGNGHRTIAHVTNTELASTVAERLLGYRQALEYACLPCDPEQILTLPFMEWGTDYQRAPEHALAEHLCQMPVRPTAVFAVNDSTALRLVAALRARGVRVPAEMAVAGIDNEERYLAGEPFLTTASQPFEEMGMEAGYLLLERLKSGRTNTFRHVLLDAPLVVRGSTEQTNPTP